MKIKVAVLAGGYSGEDVVSYKSANLVMTNIDQDIYAPYLVHITNEKWEVVFDNGNSTIDKNDFSFIENGNKIKFDFVFIMIHGSPGEDGKLQGYFDLLSLPYSTGGVLNVSLTFNKYTCNNYLRNFGINSAKSILINKNELYSTTEIAGTLKLPIFVKPNTGGSSIAIKKVYEKEALHDAINKALEVSSQVILEEFIEGVEVSGGVIVKDNELLALPLTEIVSENDFFDFEAKYEGSSQEITPARISKKMSDEIQEISKKIFNLINCKGMIRADYLIRDNKPFLIEVNTVPGFSGESLIPQQADAAGISKKELISLVINHCI